MGEDSEQPTRRECFVIAPIGPEDSDIRRRSDQILKHVIRPVVEARGFVAIRGDEIERAGLITSQVLDRIIRNDLVIADLTDQNANVFYELAVRHALRRPFVQLMAKDQQLPFDVHGMRTILVDHTDLDSVHAAKEQLGRAIDAIGSEADIVTPMSVALTLQELRGSSSPHEAGLSQVIETLPQMMDILQDLQRHLGAGVVGVTATEDDDHRRLRTMVESLASRGGVTEDELAGLLGGGSSKFERWVENLIQRARSSNNHRPV
ncbi:hypothetical protein O3597_10520 [Verrucosispora sp. WMMA2044]|uniref:hypothetical protein n=1 Tax=Verrucosispora sp. WMMA2044 TaxID=3016419 RepID=UPI00248BD44D|nr:hypothetical protein [Verrucosispora sp. WMMA2044]WBB50863.1 hypothetical protein O3597_10520 [Verrucosispora sp. WMMA2044]